MKVQLNKRAIDQATYKGPGGCYMWDAELRGFGLRIYPAGRKSFVLTYRIRGRQRCFTMVATISSISSKPVLRRSSCSERFARAKTPPLPALATELRRP